MEIYMKWLLPYVNIIHYFSLNFNIHDMPDDFTTQPSGNSGTKIACGKIEKGF